MKLNSQEALDALLGVLDTRTAIDLAQRNHIEAVKLALDLGWSKQAVSLSARVTPSAMYKSLRKVYGPRKITEKEER